ncbi:MAG TPA: glycosyltransferase family 8 protein [Chitinophagales bacterium]|nr:glycosyltransferase family 8 protein [Chitinophagales bacterium]
MLHLAITLDQNLYIQLFALLSSIISNKNNNTHIAIHCIATGLSAAQLEKITNYLQQNNISINFYEIDERLTKQFYIHNKKSFTAAAYYRLFFTDLVPENVERLLYIDIDTLVLKDLTELYYQNIDNYVIGAIYDNYVKTQELIGITEEGQYFNSGVLLIDVKKWIEQNITQKCIDYLLEYPERIKFVDQCVLNAVFQNNYFKLPIYCNMMYSYLPEKSSKEELNRIKQKITIIHFTLHKPWTMLCKNPYRKLYRYYLQKSPQKNEKVIIDFNYRKIKDLIKIRILELYLYSEFLQHLLYRSRFIFNFKK